MTYGGGPFTTRAGASDSSSTLLVQAVPHASNSDRWPKDRVWLRYVHFTPGSALLSAAPCSSGWSKASLNGEIYCSFVCRASSVFPYCEVVRL